MLLVQLGNISMNNSGYISFNPVNKLFYGNPAIANNEVATIGNINDAIANANLTNYLNLTNGGAILGDTTYKGSELATQDDLLSVSEQVQILMFLKLVIQWVVDW